MDEDSYRQMFQQINAHPCVFEKAILSLRCKCTYQQHFRLADRQGVGCNDQLKQQGCKYFLDHLRQQTRFLFKIDIEGPLPHNKEIRVQNGGMLGLQQLLQRENSVATVEDIASLISQAVESYGSIESIPYNLLMPSVSRFKARAKR